jgi:RNA polymerase sigma-70 factor (ECF subfamily)
VSATPTTEAQLESATSTLGDLLYADAGKPRVSESDWVCLVRSIAGGDQLALHALYQRTHRIVFTLIVRITGNRQTAEELTLDVFHDVWRRASRYDASGGSVVGWIMNQAHSRAIDRVRFEQRKKRVDPHADQADNAVTASEPNDSLGVLVHRDQERLLRNALSVLTVEEREAIQAAFFSELTYAEVAARLDQPLGTIKTRIRSGLAKLRQALAGGMADGVKEP